MVGVYNRNIQHDYFLYSACSRKRFDKRGSQEPSFKALFISTMFLFCVDEGAR